MARRMRVVHYINQFFGRIGGEDRADVGPGVVEGPVGPGRLLQQLLGDRGEVVATAICGDNYFAENPDVAGEEILGLIAPHRPDLLIAGPAFNAGRYGTACGHVCKIAQRDLGIPAIAGMFEENPGLELYRQDVFITRTADSALGMGEALARMVGLALKLVDDVEVGSPAEEGYFARGLQRNILSDRNAAQRAVAMLLAKLNNRPFVSELTRPVFDRVVPSPPILNLDSSTIGLVTDGGLIHKGNPDKMPAGKATRFTSNRIDGLDDLRAEDFEAFHYGYDTRYINQDPDRLAPVDVLREMERQGVIGKLLEVVYATAGVCTAQADSSRMGAAIAQQLKERGVQGVILTST